MLRINNFKYTKNAIIAPKSKAIPDVLCKYYSISDNSLNALLNNYLFAPHPMQLNDIKDSKAVLYELKYRPELSIYEEFKCSQLFDGDLKLQGKNFKQYFWRTQSVLMGIVSLTTSELNDLMWPHYTNENGFTITFDTQKLISSLKSKNEFKTFTFAPVNYVKQVCQASITPTLDNIKAANYYMSNVKNSSWKYEDEWRLFVSADGMQPPYKHYYYPDFKFTTLEDSLEKRKLYYNPEDCIKRIVWGSEFISTIAEDKGFIDDWKRYKLKKEDEQLLDVFRYISENYSNNFYISSLHRKKNRINIIKRIANVFRNEIEGVGIERAIDKFNIKVNGNYILVKKE
tara:strand:- start:9249 stop:10277 length:1029 start_codon:yes stop_codon:yes gene_type:complete